MTKTYTRTAYGRILTLEMVNTWELKEHDAIYNHGCMMICGPFEDEVSKYGQKPQHDSKGARWCTAEIVLHEEGGIPAHWMGKREDSIWPTWTVQGNTRAFWSRIIENAPA